jgi:tRNA-specific 2-thiouridylase
VIDRFVADYSRGRTPNPCIECNRSVKFDELLRHARDLGADYLATGHYARIRYNEGTGRHELMRARDQGKDQSYALYTLTQEQLRQTLMPLGHLADKQETRRLAREFGLALAGKPDSQEICFVPKEGYVSFLQDKAPETVRPGTIVDTSGKRIGEHAGVALYTIGQRKRMPANSGGALFVVALDAETNTVVAGSDAELYTTGLTADTCIWSAIPALTADLSPLSVQAKIRYNGVAAPARIYAGPQPDEVHARFDAPQRAITPGQSAVFYGGEGEDTGQVVLGGGIITGALRDRAE